jgi:RNA polymerase sigma factor (sigma-70 family)
VGDRFRLENRNTTSDYRRLLNALASRASRLGSHDPESAAQETLKRSLGNPAARCSIEYFFGEEPPPGSARPDWPLDHLLAWLHGVLNFVVREEQNRVGHRREVLLGQIGSGLGWDTLDPADPAPGQLDVLIQREMQQIVVECLPALDSGYREVLALRADGLKYDEIAARLGINENTVATWVSRGIRTLAQYVRRRADRKHAGAAYRSEASGEELR